MLAPLHPPSDFSLKYASPPHPSPSKYYTATYQQSIEIRETDPTQISNDTCTGAKCRQYIPTWSACSICSKRSNLYISQVTRKPIFGGVRPSKTQTSLLSYRLRWSAPLLFAYGIRQVFSWQGSNGNPNHWQVKASEAKISLLPIDGKCSVQEKKKTITFIWTRLYFQNCVHL